MGKRRYKALVKMSFVVGDCFIARKTERRGAFVAKRLLGFRWN